MWSTSSASAKLFKTLPKEEKQLWHSHNYEVQSGTLVAPGLPEIAEHELMEKIASTYGKTWHTDQDMVAERDKHFDILTEEKRKNRADIKTPPPDPDANAWQKGEVAQIQRSLLRNVEEGKPVPQTPFDKTKVTGSSE